MRSSLKPEKKDLKNLLIATTIITIAFAAYRTQTEILGILKLLGISVLILATRDIGQRILAQWMDAYIDVEIDQEGAGVTIIAAIIAAATNISLIILVPIYSTFSGHKYEQWGKSVDAVWAKRQYWLATGGILSLITLLLITLILGFHTITVLAGIFTFYQLLPLDYSGIPTGTLDGAYILRWSGYTYLILTGTTILLTTIAAF